MKVLFEFNKIFSNKIYVFLRKIMDNFQKYIKIIYGLSVKKKTVLVKIVMKIVFYGKCLWISCKNFWISVKSMKIWKIIEKSKNFVENFCSYRLIYKSHKKQQLLKIQNLWWKISVHRKNSLIFFEKVMILLWRSYG